MPNANANRKATCAACGARLPMSRAGLLRAHLAGCRLPCSGGEPFPLQKLRDYEGRSHPLSCRCQREAARIAGRNS